MMVMIFSLALWSRKLAEGTILQLLESGRKSKGTLFVEDST